MEADKEAQMQGLLNRQQRMFNWEDKMKKQEMQFMDQFEQQKNALKAKKLADQQKELLKDMNQKDVDVMLARHKKELEAIETALAAEQKRQMDQMKEQMKSRNAKLAGEKALRQIKLAEIQKLKDEKVTKQEAYFAEYMRLEEVIETVESIRNAQAAAR